MLLQDTRIATLQSVRSLTVSLRNRRRSQELAARTGLNPQYTYLQIGCSKKQENAMLRFARSCVGKPFSGSAMARSLLWPRQTDNKSFFCAGV